MAKHPSAVLQGAEKYREDLARFAARLIQARSLSGDESAVVDVIRKEMERGGFDDVWTDRFGNVIGRVGTGSRLIAMDAHIDTVDVGDISAWTRPPFGGEIDGTWVYGRGAADQKSGMASMVYGMRLLKDLALMADCTILVVGSVLEEDCDGLCWRYMVEEDGLRPDVAVITEPTGLRIHRGQRGRIELNIRTQGISAHASAPERGDNAVYKMARIVGVLEALNDQLHHDPFLGKGTLVVSKIMSESPSVNAVPDQCTIHLDRRLTAGESGETAIAELERAVRPIDPSAEIVELNYDGASYTGLRYPAPKLFPSWVLPESHPVISAAAETYRHVFDQPPVISRWDFSTNGTVLAGVYGIPTVGFGPGDEIYAHAPNEKVLIDHLVAAAAFYAAFPRVLCDLLTRTAHSKKEAS